jgi:hypothetical protein
MLLFGARGGGGALAPAMLLEGMGLSTELDELIPLSKWSFGTGTLEHDLSLGLSDNAGSDAPIRLSDLFRIQTLKVLNILTNPEDGHEEGKGKDSRAEVEPALVCEARSVHEGMVVVEVFCPPHGRSLNREMSKRGLGGVPMPERNLSLRQRILLQAHKLKELEAKGDVDVGLKPTTLCNKTLPNYCLPFHSICDWTKVVDMRGWKDLEE